MVRLSNGDLLEIGRGQDSSLQLNDPSISRSHFKIKVDDGRLMLVDQGSRGGTFVNEKRIEAIELSVDDVIRAGRTQIRVEQEDDGFNEVETWFPGSSDFAAVLSEVVQESQVDTQLQLFVEEICGELCRFQHMSTDGLRPEDVRVSKEVYLGIPGAFADILVEPASQPKYIVEVKIGKSHTQVVASLARKYGPPGPTKVDALRIILVIDSAESAKQSELLPRIQHACQPGLRFEIWDQKDLMRRIRDCFNVEIDQITPDNLVETREAIDHAKWLYAFGDEYEHHRLQPTLLWHFGYWRLRQLHDLIAAGPNEIISAKCYGNVAICLADLCSFSSFLRDTDDSRIARDALTNFYSKSRYAVIDNGGMLYQFVGDEVIGLFGIPDQSPKYVERALDCAKSLVDIGNSVSEHWQRNIDRPQNSGGVHVAIGIGELEVVHLRPYSRSHIGMIGDSFNMAARLMSTAGSGEIVVSNRFYHELEEESQVPFEELTPIEGRNVGWIKGWMLKPHS